jgi:hypothetical protein
MVGVLSGMGALRFIAIVTIVVLPLLALAAALAAVLLREWWLPVAVVFVLYYGFLVVVGARWVVRYRAGLAQRPVESAALPAVERLSALTRLNAPDWLVTGADADAQNTRMLAWFSSVGDQNLRLSGLVSKVPGIRDVLARLATRGRLSYPELIAAVELFADDATRSAAKLILGWVAVPTIVILAQVVHGQDLEADDRRNAIALLDWTVEMYGVARLAEADRIGYASFLVQADRREEAAQVVLGVKSHEIATTQIAADVLNPFQGDVSLGASESLWLAVFNGVFSEYGLEPLTLSGDETKLPFDRISSQAARVARSRNSDGPMATIITAAFQPDEGLLTSVRSVVDQTWGNWELLLFDDASGDEFLPLFEQCAALDDRIRLIRNKENIGTYGTRNVALDQAAGDFVTIQDADDWMHPRRLELQIRHLVEHAAEMANISFALRVSEQLSFAQDRGYDLKLCEPSILFRREVALSTVGYFDRVRSGGDSEFRWRIAAAQGHPVVVLDMFPPLTLQRFSPGSLSGSDFSTGWMHPSRMAYRSAWRQWHADVVAAGAIPSLDKEQKARAFPAPVRTLGEVRPATDPYDLLMVLDFSHRLRTAPLLEQVGAELDDLVNRGFRIAVLQMWTVGFAPTREIRQSAAIQRHINSGAVDQVFLDDEIRVERVIVRTPDSLQFIPTTKAGIVAGSVHIVWPAPTVFIVNSDCERNALELFGQSATWMSVRDISELRREPA